MSCLLPFNIRILFPITLIVFSNLFLKQNYFQTDYKFYIYLSFSSANLHLKSITVFGKFMTSLSTHTHTAQICTKLKCKTHIKQIYCQTKAQKPKQSRTNNHINRPRKNGKPKQSTLENVKFIRQKTDAQNKPGHSRFVSENSKLSIEMSSRMKTFSNKGMNH